MSSPRPIDISLLKEMPLPALAGETDKNSRGRVLVVGGSRCVPGAVVLSGLAALRIGAGKIQIATPTSIATAVGLTLLEAGVYPLHESREGEPIGAPLDALISLARAVDAILVGPGILSQPSAQHLVECFLREVVGPTYVIDALVLCALWNEMDHLRVHGGRVILTPHAGEMAQLARIEKSVVDEDPIRISRESAARLSSVVVLKGASTLIVSPSGLAYCHSQGVVGLATAGSGDVLAGIIAGLASRGAAPMQAATWGVFLHGRAGHQLTQCIGPVGFLAREVIEQLPALLAGTEAQLQMR
jgi:ADP-dependent NAD(P)H-hydrate dehydratase